MEPPDVIEHGIPTQVMRPIPGEAMPVPQSPEQGVADFLDDFSLADVVSTEGDQRRRTTSWIAGMFDDESPTAAERGPAAQERDGERREASEGREGPAEPPSGAAPSGASAATISGDQMNAMVAELVRAMTRAVEQGRASSSHERSPVKLAKMPTQGDRTLPSIKSWNQWYDVRLRSWAGAQTPGFVEALDAYVKNPSVPEENALNGFERDNRLLAYELCAM